MNATTLPTPADLSITPRDRRFGRGDGHAASVARRARRSDRNLQCAVGDLSRSGEAFFVESVRAFRDGAPPKLADEIKAFTTQEAIHSREHDAFNRRAADAGYDLTKLEQRVE